jgi:pimeloyl-ACP methyl ester carboxylesterase
MDYRGLGSSEGQPTIENLQSDTAALIDLAAAANKKIVMHGLSMGSVLAARAASDSRVSSLVPEGGITTPDQFIDATMPGWLKLFVHVNKSPEIAEIDNLTSVRCFERPLLVMAESNDAETPPVLSQRLHDVSPSSHKHLLHVTGADHRTTMTFPQAVVAYQHFLAQDVLASP